MFRLSVLAALSGLVTLGDAKLIFRPFEPKIPCADGSDAGIYFEDLSQDNAVDPTRHVIVFSGGGACTSPSDCKYNYFRNPSLFSSTVFPTSVEGDTILSSSRLENPEMYNYTKTLVPYCTQDFFLGDINKGKIGDFQHGGSAAFDAALAAWTDFVTAEIRSGKPDLESVVFVGISAGAVGLMNKINKVYETVNRFDVTSIRFVLDSPSVISDRAYIAQDFNEMMQTYVDLKENDLCSPTNYYSLLYADGASSLPCCLSPHCML